MDKFDKMKDGDGELNQDDGSHVKTGAGIGQYVVSERFDIAFPTKEVRRETAKPTTWTRRRLWTATPTWTARAWRRRAVVSSNGEAKRAELIALADELDLQSFCEHASSSSVRSLRAASLCACSAHQRQSRPSRRIAIAGGMTAVRAP